MFKFEAIEEKLVFVADQDAYEFTVEQTPVLAFEAVSIISVFSGDPGYFEHLQEVASTEWVVTHNLNKNPAVTIIDTSGAECIGDVIHVSKQQTIIYFSAPFSGKAIFN